MAFRKPRTLQAPPPPTTQAGVTSLGTQEGQAQAGGLEMFGTPEEQEGLIQLAMQKTGYTRERLMNLGQRGIDYENQKIAANPQRATQGAGRDEIQRVLSDLRTQAGATQTGSQLWTDPLMAGGAASEGSVNVGAPAPQPSQFASAEAPAPPVPAFAGYARMLQDRMGKLENEINLERQNNVENAGRDAFDAGVRRGQQQSILAAQDRTEGSPENRERLAQAQNRRAMAKLNLQDRLKSLNRRA